MKKIIIIAFLLSTINFNTYSDQFDLRLKTLFDDLTLIENELNAGPTINQIWSIWSETGNFEAQQKFNLGNQYMAKRQYLKSIDMFSEALDVDPNFAEAWNKRATLHYIIGDYEKSVSDISKTLELEPRHFGALDGLAEIYISQDQFEKAAQTYKKILEILPYSKKAKMRLEYIQQSFI